MSRTIDMLDRPKIHDFFAIRAFADSAIGAEFSPRSTTYVGGRSADMAGAPFADESEIPTRKTREMMYIVCEVEVSISGGKALIMEMKLCNSTEHWETFVKVLHPHAFVSAPR